MTRRSAWRSPGCARRDSAEICGLAGREEAFQSLAFWRDVEAARRQPVGIVIVVAVALAAVADQCHDGAALAMVEHLRNEPERTAEVRAGGPSDRPAEPIGGQVHR